MCGQRRAASASSFRSCRKDGLSSRPNETLRTLLDEFFAAEGVFDPVLWYYTPMSLDFTDHLKGRVTVYDCMDELSAFKGAPPELIERERTLLSKADLVFTGGYSL